MTTTYLLGSDERERRRLTAQAGEIDRISERMLREAGVEEGMRVLELGTGAGDVALLLARLVGPGGEIVGVERDPAMIEAARARVADADNVRVVESDVAYLDGLEGPFDAVVGRLILLYVDDPAAVLRSAAKLAPGGVVCFQDYVLESMRCHPPVAAVDELVSAVLACFEHSGQRLDFGLTLRSAYGQAGLLDPQLRMETPIGRANVASMLAGVVATLAPLMARLGVGPDGSVDPAELTQRIAEDVDRAQAVLVAPSLVGAWATAPPV